MNKKICFVILLSAAMLISPLARIALGTNPYTDPTAVAWNVDGSFSFVDMLRANHTYIPADKVANPVQKLTISWDIKMITSDIKVGGVTYSLGKDFTYTGHAEFIFYNPSFANPALGYLYPSGFSKEEGTLNYMYNFSAVPGGLEGTLSMLNVMDEVAGSGVSVGGTGDFKNVEVKSTSYNWFDSANLVINVYHDGMVSGWPKAVPTFMTADTGVTYTQLTDYCTNVWGLSSNPYPTFPAGVPTQYLIFNVVIDDKFYLGVSCNSYTGVYDPVTKTAAVTYNATWYLGDSYKGVAKMDQGFKGTVVFTLLNYTPANATATPPTPATYTVGPGVFNLQGFGALTGQNLILRADGSVTPILAKGYAVIPQPVAVIDGVWFVVPVFVNSTAGTPAPSFVADKVWTSNDGKVLHSMNTTISTYIARSPPGAAGTVRIGTMTATSDFVFDTVSQTGTLNMKLKIALTNSSNPLYPNPYGVGTLEGTLTADVTSLNPYVSASICPLPGDAQGYLIATNGTGAFINAKLEADVTMSPGTAIAGSNTIFIEYMFVGNHINHLYNDGTLTFYPPRP